MVHGFVTLSTPSLSQIYILPSCSEHLKEKGHFPMDCSDLGQNSLVLTTAAQRIASSLENEGTAHQSFSKFMSNVVKDYNKSLVGYLKFLHEFSPATVYKIQEVAATGILTKAKDEF